MLLVLISLIVFGLLVLVAIRISFNKKEVNIEEVNPILHASGIYSIIRKSPREQISQIKPSNEDIRKYLLSINVNTMQNDALSGEKIRDFLYFWDKTLNENLKVIEQGDNEGVSFYYYDFFPDTCPVCKDFLKKGQFVTREEIFQFPAIIPPFHIGCTCKLVSFCGKENLQETTESGMIPLFRDKTFPRLPDWKTIKLSNAV